MSKHQSKPKRVVPAAPLTPGESVVLDIRDVPAYRATHGLRIVRAEWPLVHDDWANGKMRPAEKWPTLVVEPVEPQKGQSAP